MSLVTVFCNEQGALIAADSRVSITEDNVSYYVHDNYSKLKTLNNKVVFASGLLSNVVKFFDSITENMTVEQIKNVAKKFAKNEKNALAIVVLSIENNKYRFTQYAHNASQESHEEDVILNTGQIKLLGAYQDEGTKFIADNHKSDIVQTIKDMYDYVAAEEVGGTLQLIYHINDQMSYEEYIIKDSRPLKKWNPQKSEYLHATLAGHLKATSAEFKGSTFTNGAIEGSTLLIGSGNNVFKADEKGIYLGHSTYADAPFKVGVNGVATMSGANISGNITMTGGSIQWGNVPKPTYNAWEVGALSTMSPQLTYIGANGIYTGQLSANQIVAGTIDASRINVNSLHVNKLYNTTNTSNYATIGGSYSDLTLYYNNNPYFQVYNEVSSVQLRAYGQAHMRLGVDGNTHILNKLYVNGQEFDGTARFA